VHKWWKTKLAEFNANSTGDEKIPISECNLLPVGGSLKYMVKHILFAILLSASISGIVTAQVLSTAFDPHCYQPQIGVPGVIDTIMGGKANQVLGGNQFSPGPAPGSSYNRTLFTGYPNNPLAWDVVAGSPSLNIHDLNKPKLNTAITGYTTVTGHFRSPNETDILHIDAGSVYIYWGDENGNYDSSRFTTLGYRAQGGPDNGASDPNTFSPYIAHLTSDSVDDLVLCFVTGYYPANGRPDSEYVVFYKGGVTLYQPGSIVLNDTGAYFPPEHGNGTRHGCYGDFRGIGRKDYLGADPYGNLFIYKNDPPFDITRFANAMRYDTIYAAWQNPGIYPDRFSDYWNLTLKSIQVFPHSNQTSTVDFIGALQRRDNDSSWSANFWKGGPSFGSTRITANDTTLCIRSPYYYDPAAWYGMGFGAYPVDCGDMTGTGNRVILMGGGDGGSAYQFFYVMGKASDPLVDMYFSIPDGAGGTDTITADGDRLQDLILSDSWLGPDGESRQAGGILVVHGSKNIPVTLNSRFGLVQSQTISANAIGITLGVDSRSLIVSMTLAKPGDITFRVYNLLGQSIYEQQDFGAETSNKYLLPLPQLASGSYVLEVTYGSPGVTDGSFTQTKVFSIVR
jgi:hypothetical protein